ncbi:MAG TPA: hypothetical protein VG943_08210 [Caulobacterales bacterium]|nr:hypothetical protein [Caulobacterales bacterium]
MADKQTPMDKQSQKMPGSGTGEKPMPKSAKPMDAPPPKGKK